MTRNQAIVTVFALFALSVFAPREASAIRGRLDSADVAYAESYPAEARIKVRSALQREGCKFLGGSFINSVSRLQYAGNAASLSRQLDDLTKCPEVKVSVQFRKLAEKCDWIIVHDADDNRFTVQINLNSDQIDLEKLDLPSVNGP